MPDGNNSSHMSPEAKGEFRKVHSEVRTNMTISAGTALALIAFLFTGWTWASDAHQTNSESVAVERTRNNEQADEIRDVRKDLTLLQGQVTDAKVSSEVTIRLLNELKEDVGELGNQLREMDRRRPN